MNLRVQDKRMLDHHGRERIFNGINLVYKGSSDEGVLGGRNYIKHFDEETFAALSQKGINLIRLGIIWDALEMEMGNYNDQYLAWIKSILDYCHKYDIAVFLDMHQDLYSRSFDGGAPLWATLTDGTPHIEGDLWSDAYLFSEAVNHAYLNFWKNTQVEGGKGLLDHYCDLWSHVIDQLGSHKALVGYDFINEPFPGERSLEIMGALLMTYSAIKGWNKTPEEMFEAYQDPSMKEEMLRDLNNSEIYEAMIQSAKPLVADFDKGYLANFYNLLSENLRKKTSNGLILTENCYFSNMGIESSLEPIRIHGKREPLQVFSPHGYDLVVDTPAIIYASNQRIKTILDAHKRVQDRLNVPVIFGEWGAHGAHKDGLEHIGYILNYFDQNKWSHTYYCYEDHMENLPVMALLCRPYPQAVSGEILSYGYDQSTKRFHLKWLEGEKLTQPTQIYLPSEPLAIESDGAYEIQTKEDGKKYLIINPKGDSNRNLLLRWC